MDELLTIEKLNSLYGKLAEPLPAEAIQKADMTAFKGYSAIGLSYQFCCNRLNEVLGPAHWTEEHEVISKNITTTSKNVLMYDITIRMTIKIGNWHNSISEGKSYFEVLAQRTCYGGHTAKLEVDAYKGAFTNAFKKTVALFGVGRQAYEGSIDDDFLVPDEYKDSNEPKSDNKKPTNTLEIDPNKMIIDGQKRAINSGVNLHTKKGALRYKENGVEKTFKLDEYIKTKYNADSIDKLKYTEAAELIELINSLY